MAVVDPSRRAVLQSLPVLDDLNFPLDSLAWWCDGEETEQLRAVKSKGSRIIRPKPEPKPNIRLPLKEAEVFF